VAVSRRRIRDLVVGVLLATLVWLFYRANRKEPQEVDSVDRVILTVSAPLERAFLTVFDAWMKVWKQYLYRVDLKRENERLARQNAELEAHNRYMAAVARRGRQLERFRAYMEGSAAEMLPATVARRRIDTDKFRVIGIVIDRRYPNVSCGAPVVIPQGVVGRVLYFELPGCQRIACPVETAVKKKRVQRCMRQKGARIGRALVQLSVDPQSTIDVRVPRTGARGMLRGIGWDEGFVARITHMSPHTKVAPGDLVVTTGVDGRFPAGLPVGRVLSLHRRPGQDPRVLVRPAVDFGKLSRVLVVISPPPPPVPKVRRQRFGRLGLVPYP
jgi:rod shape-determining protein MreC